MTYQPAPGTEATWPASHRAALIVLIHVDGPSLEPAATPDAAGIDYTATGLQRLLTILADLDLPATIAWTRKALSIFPQLARSAQDYGHEIAASKVRGGPESEHDQLLERISDMPLAGMVEALPGAPTPDHTSETSALRAAPALAWRITGVGGDLPVATSDGNGAGVTVIPVSPYWIDTTWLDPSRPQPPSSLLEAWSLSLAAVRSEGGLMTVVLHPHVSGRPGIAGQVTRFFDEVIDSGDVWIASAAQVAAWWQQGGSAEP